MMLQIAVPDVKEAAKGADILVFVLPHQFVRGVCNQLKGTLKEGTIAVTLIKVGMSVHCLLCLFLLFPRLCKPFNGNAVSHRCVHFFGLKGQKYCMGDEVECRLQSVFCLVKI